MRLHWLFAIYVFIILVHIVFIAFGTSCENVKNVNQSFCIDYDNDTFLKSGAPFRYISGSIHYSRVPSVYWQDRLDKIYFAGLNAIQVYVPWNFHENSVGKFNFKGDANLTNFLLLAHQRGLLVILRPGPYICAEWDFGGLPAWLLQNTSIALRSSDSVYLEAVDSWMNVLLPKIKPFLFENGGPIITVQVENEYGSFPACDHNYMHHLTKLFRYHLGENVVLFTTDGPAESYLKCGTLENLYATVDFGTGGNVSKYFAAQRLYEPKGPLVNSEFYTGWLDHWGQRHSVTSTAAITKRLDELLMIGANVNMYMFEGGTNFGFWNGANGGKTSFNPQPTSYDYDAPLSEAGDQTDKYFAIREVISRYSEIPLGNNPGPTPKYGYGIVQMSFQTTLMDVLHKLAPYGPTNSTYPITMEHMKQYSGFILYRTLVPVDATSPLLLSSSAIRDRGYVMINQIPMGILTRLKDHSLSITAEKGDILDILIENQGHINYGGDMADPKGIFGNVTFNGMILANWSTYALNFNGLMPFPEHHIAYKHVKGKYSTVDILLQQPSFFVGQMPDVPEVDPPRDTFLKMSGWSKGQAYINGFNIGRYWPDEGPQVTLFVPASILKPSPQKNILLLFELETAPCESSKTCTVEFVDRPIINGPVHRLESSIKQWQQREMDVLNRV